MQFRFYHLITFILFAILFNSLTWAQPNSGTQPPTTQVAAADKSNKEAVCDGALDIIPQGAMTFARKRYVPSKPKPRTSKVNTKLRR